MAPSGIEHADKSGRESNAEAGFCIGEPNIIVDVTVHLPQKFSLFG